MRDVVRSPLVPLELWEQTRGVKKEILIDYDMGEIYVISPEGLPKLINITAKIKQAVINYINSTQGDQITDITNTYVTIDDLGRINVAELLQFMIKHHVDAFPCDKLGPVALTRVAYDDASIIVAKNRVRIAGYDEAGIGYIPMKSEGSITWVPVSQLPTPDGYTPNKYDIGVVSPIDDIINLTDNPIQKSANLEGNITIKLPKVNTDYCIIQWMMTTVDSDPAKGIFPSNITWKYNTDTSWSSGKSYIYIFETFDKGITWYGQRISFGNQGDSSTMVSTEELYNNYFTKQETIKMLSWNALDSESILEEGGGTGDAEHDAKTFLDFESTAIRYYR